MFAGPPVLVSWFTKAKPCTMPLYRAGDRLFWSDTVRVEVVRVARARGGEYGRPEYYVRAVRSGRGFYAEEKYLDGPFRKNDPRWTRKEKYRFDGLTD